MAAHPPPGHLSIAQLCMDYGHHMLCAHHPIGCILCCVCVRYNLLPLIKMAMPMARAGYGFSSVNITAIKSIFKRATLSILPTLLGNRLRK